jgi:head-tail adaptor
MARIRSINARGLLEGVRIEHIVSYEVAIRHPRLALEIQPETWRVRLPYRILNIEGVYDPDNRRNWLVLMCVEGDRGKIELEELGKRTGESASGPGYSGRVTLGPGEY